MQEETQYPGDSSRHKKRKEKREYVSDKGSLEAEIFNLHRKSQNANIMMLETKTAICIYHGPGRVPKISSKVKAHFHTVC